MLNLFLADESTGTTSSDILSWVVVIVLIVALVAMVFISSRRSKKRQKEAEDLVNAVRPGNKVKTIGGICGIVVEVDDAENTFVLETGSEESGKCFLKFDKQAIYQTDAVVTPEQKNDEKPAESGEVFGETAEKQDEPAEEPAETPAEEPAKEE